MENKPCWSCRIHMVNLIGLLNKILFQTIRRIKFRWALFDKCECSLVSLGKNKVRHYNFFMNLGVEERRGSEILKFTLFVIL